MLEYERLVPFCHFFCQTMTMLWRFSRWSVHGISVPMPQNTSSSLSTNPDGCSYCCKKSRTHPTTRKGWVNKITKNDKKKRKKKTWWGIVQAPRHPVLAHIPSRQEPLLLGFSLQQPVQPSIRSYIQRACSSKDFSSTTSLLSRLVR